MNFGEALGMIGGPSRQIRLPQIACRALFERKLHYFAMVDLGAPLVQATLSTPHLDTLFIKACPAETTAAFCDGHNAALFAAALGPVSRDAAHSSAACRFRCSMTIRHGCSEDLWPLSAARCACA